VKPGGFKDVRRFLTEALEREKLGGGQWGKAAVEAQQRSAALTQLASKNKNSALTKKKSSSSNGVGGDGDGDGGNNLDNFDDDDGSDVSFSSQQFLYLFCLF
jgi:hypothetical protein